jgi:single-stranded-DNA-specific exonuclease
MFYVLMATRALLRERGAFADRAAPGALLDLAALGTVADVVRSSDQPTLVSHGLARIRAGPRGRVCSLFAARAAIRGARPATTWGSQSGRGSTPQGESPT